MLSVSLVFVFSTCFSLLVVLFFFCDSSPLYLDTRMCFSFDLLHVLCDSDSLVLTGFGFVFSLTLILDFPSIGLSGILNHACTLTTIPASPLLNSFFTSLLRASGSFPFTSHSHS